MAKTYYSVPDKSSGNTFTEQMWDESIRANINNLRVPASCRVYQYGLSLADGANPTFGSENHDTDSMHSTSSNTSRITINTAGIYIITGTIQWQYNAGGGYRGVGIEVSGTDIYTSTLVQANGAVGAGTHVQVATILACTAGQYLELVAAHNVGGSIGTDYCNFAACWVGQTS